MSAKPIWSLNAKRSELGGATKGQIYLSKIGIGLAVWLPCWLVSAGALAPTLHLCIAVFITSKVCYYVNKNESPSGWDAVADWCCDGCLALAWLLWPWLLTGNYTAIAILVGLWGATFPWSCE